MRSPLEINMTYKVSESTKVLILCAGESTRWANYLDVPKQLISFNGESLMNRMVRLLHNKGFYDVVVISHDERLRLSNCGFFKPSKHRLTVETLLSTRSLWTDKTLILLGDVFFTEKAINTITNSDQGIHVYGRPGASRYTFSLHGEIFAISFEQNSWDRVVAHTENARRDAEMGGRGKLWELYRSFAGYSLNEHRIENEIFISIHDLTDDIDYPYDYNRLVKIFTYVASTNRYKWILILYSWLGLSLVSFFPYLMKFLKRNLKKSLKRIRLYGSRLLVRKNH